MLLETEQANDTIRNSEQHFEYCIAELIKAKEKMTEDAVASKDPERIKSALIKLLESNKTLISALDVAYKKLHEARLGMSSK